jgi:hypothetical protein
VLKKIVATGIAALALGLLPEHQGGLETQECNFKIKDGTNITFFLTEFHKSQWDRCAPSAGCGKRRHFWASHAGNDGCRATGQRAPCGYGVGAIPNVNDPADFLGEA